MRRLALIVGAAGALSACATPVERTPPSMVWTVDYSAEAGGRLVLGTPNTDDLKIIMTCRPRSGRIVMTLSGRLDDPAALELWSVKVAGRYAGAGTVDELTGGRDIQLTLRSDDPVMRRWADTGELMVVFPKRRIVLPNAFSPAHDFLNICRAG